MGAAHINLDKLIFQEAHVSGVSGWKRAPLGRTNLCSCHTTVRAEEDIVFKIRN